MIKDLITNKTQIVIDLGFGDGGKGRVVSWLCDHSNPELVVRFSGGQQAAHHVYPNQDEYHIFSNFGSGSFHVVPTYFAGTCTIDPVGILNEARILDEKFCCHPVLYIDPKCPVTTFLEKHISTTDPRFLRDGTCGVGVGQTWERESKRYSLLAEDLLTPSIFQIKLDLILSYYNTHYGILESQEWITNERDRLFEIVQELLNKPNIHVGVSRWTDIRHSRVIFEGSQGLLLDQDIGFFPHVTRSNTGTQNLPPSEVIDGHVLLVTRAYQTRHGNGPMTFEGQYEPINNPFEHQCLDGTQGPFRTSILDLDLLLHGLRCEPYLQHANNKTLVITCMDLVTEGWNLAHGGYTMSFRTEGEFVDYISRTLGITNVLLSHAPRGDMQIHSCARAEAA